MKKGAALLIVILLIAILANVAIMVSRSGFLNNMFNANIVNAMVAEQASQAGLEYALLKDKNGDSVDCLLNLETGDCGGGSRSPNTRYAEIKISSDETAKKIKIIESTGYFNNIQKKHTLTQTFESE